MMNRLKRLGRWKKPQGSRSNAADQSTSCNLNTAPGAAGLGPAWVLVRRQPLKEYLSVHHWPERCSKDCSRICDTDQHTAKYRDLSYSPSSPWVREGGGARWVKKQEAKVGYEMMMTAAEVHVMAIAAQECPTDAPTTLGGRQVCATLIQLLVYMHRVCRAP